MKSEAKNDFENSKDLIAIIQQAKRPSTPPPNKGEAGASSDDHPSFSY